MVSSSSSPSSSSTDTKIAEEERAASDDETFLGKTSIKDLEEAIVGAEFAEVKGALREEGARVLDLVRQKAEEMNERATGSTGILSKFLLQYLQEYYLQSA